MNGIHRFLSKREKHDKVRLPSPLRMRLKTDPPKEPVDTPKPPKLFCSEQPSVGKHGNSSEEDLKIKSLERRVARSGIPDLGRPQIRYALQSKYANGDPDKAFEFLMILEDSMEGIVRAYTPSIKLLGAENREGVTCYLDALLFAMFARLDCFEAILYNSFNDLPRRNLAIVLRLWVNMLRSGKLITTDLTKHLQDALSECGWKEAAKIRQQDASEAFTFITEKLDLPLLTLKMDIYHTGKEDVTDDHKFVNERLLEVAIPPDPGDGKHITLEDCLEMYFNNRIEVKRYLERRNTISSARSSDSISKGFATYIETIELGSSSPSLSPLSIPALPIEMAVSPKAQTEIAMSPATPAPRNRAPSIIQERFIPHIDSSSKEISDRSTVDRDGTGRKGSIRKEVMMPAWQIFSLIPWYTDNKPTSDTQMAAHFSSKRPIVGLCLKRYSMLPNGKAVRLNTYIDIPVEIGLPYFTEDDDLEEEAPIYGKFKLSLQAVVCHQGNSVDSGHYIALVRSTVATIDEQSSQSSQTRTNSPIDASQYWMRFDDLAKERITLVDIGKALKHESPYLLFYQILPINDDSETELSEQNPPPYDDIDVAGVPASESAFDITSSSTSHSEADLTEKSGDVIILYGVEGNGSDPLAVEGSGERLTVERDNRENEGSKRSRSRIGRLARDRSKEKERRKDTTTLKENKKPDRECAVM